VCLFSLRAICNAKTEAIEVINFLKRGQVYDTIKNYTVHYDKTWIYDRIHHSVNQV